MDTARRTGASPLPLQLLLGAGAIGGFALTPPAQGAMLLLPIAAAQPVERIAIDDGATVLARGPGRGVVVRGRRSALMWPMLRHGVLTLAAPDAWCGGTRA